MFKIVFHGDIIRGNEIFNNIYDIYKDDDKTSLKDRVLNINYIGKYIENARWTINFQMYNTCNKDFYASSRPSALSVVSYFVLLYDFNNTSKDEIIQHYGNLHNLSFNSELDNITCIFFNSKDDEVDDVLEAIKKVNKKANITIIREKEVSLIMTRDVLSHIYTNLFKKD